MKSVSVALLLSHLSVSSGRCRLHFSVSLHSSSRSALWECACVSVWRVRDCLRRTQITFCTATLPHLGKTRRRRRRSEIKMFRTENGKGELSRIESRNISDRVIQRKANSELWKTSQKYGCFMWLDFHLCWILVRVISVWNRTSAQMAPPAHLFSSSTA